MNCVVIVILFLCGIVSGDEGVMVAWPALSFIQDPNQAVELTFRFKSDRIDIKKQPFTEQFKISLDGDIIQQGYATTVKPGNPYVDFKLLEVQKEGVYIGAITGSSSTATAIVKRVRGEEPVVVAKAGASVTLQCTDDPPGAERVWRIGDTFFNSERKGWIEADDGSLAIQEIELNDGSKEIGCFYFNGTGLKEVYQQNKSALLPYQTAFTATPLIVFKGTKTGISEDRVKYTIQTVSIKAGLTVEICGALNGTSLCVQNQSVALDSRGANFTLSLGNKVLYTGLEFEVKKPEKPADEDGSTGAIVGGIVGALVATVAIGAILFYVCYWRKRPRQTEETMNLKTPKKKENGTQQEKQPFPLQNGEGH